jgi:glyoxylase-like metal-dependent hydrolase (beta-lactamase superfamily II)
MVHRWDIISIGNLSRNRYWGESDGQSYRSALCTSTLITGDGFRMLVDPPYGDLERMASELFRRTGAKIDDVDTVFLTHQHGDHVVGLKHFPHATWLAAPEVAEIINGSGKFDKSVEAAGSQVFGCVEPIHTPGHTLSHHSLKFDWDGYRVVIAADAAMTPDFWANRQGYFNSVDFDAAARSIEKLHKLADIVVPGHDNYFMVGG